MGSRHEYVLGLLTRLGSSDLSDRDQEILQGHLGRDLHGHDNPRGDVVRQEIARLERMISINRRTP